MRPDNVLINKKGKNRRFNCRCCGGRSGEKHCRAGKHLKAAFDGFAMTVQGGRYKCGPAVPSVRLNFIDYDEVQNGLPALDGCASCGAVKCLSACPTTGELHCDDCFLEWGVSVEYPPPQQHHGKRQKKGSPERSRPPQFDPHSANNKVVKCQFGALIPTEEFQREQQVARFSGRPRTRKWLDPPAKGAQPVRPVFTQTVMLPKAKL